MGPQSIQYQNIEHSSDFEHTQLIYSLGKLSILPETINRILKIYRFFVAKSVFLLGTSLKIRCRLPARSKCKDNSQQLSTAQIFQIAVL